MYSGSSWQVVQLLGKESVSVEQHSPIILLCRVSPATPVTWKRDSETINADSTKQITIAFNSSTHDSVLTIAEAELMDSGSYTCSAGDAQSDKTVHVTVTESESEYYFILK